jgi:nucleotide-binding universal stress UspA family protein
MSSKQERVMLTTMLVLLNGTAVDSSVSATAATIGRRLQAHLECYHPRFRAADVALATPYSGFALGTAVVEMLDEIDEDSDRRATAARECFQDLCRRERLPVMRTPQPGLFSATWLNRQSGSVEEIVQSARYRDLIIIGRTGSGYGLPSDFLEQLVLNSGRPILVAPDRSTCPAPETIAVWWKENAYSARALFASLPLLTRAKRVIVTAAKEDSGKASDLTEVVDELCLRGIAAEASVLQEGRDPTAHRLIAAAEEHDVDLVVLGAYGHSHTREIFFGGVTQAVLEGADLPVLLVH